MEAPSGFEHGIPGLTIERPNHQTIALNCTTPLNCDERNWLLMNLHKTANFDKNRFLKKLYESLNGQSLSNYLAIKAYVIGLPNFHE